MKINGDLYLNRLIKAKHDNFVKIITGIRRCGKCHLLFNLFKQHLLDEGVQPDHIIEINLEKKSAAGLRTPDPLLEHVKKRLTDDGKMNYVFIDEIQMCKKTLNPDIDISRIHPDDLEDEFACANPSRIWVVQHVLLKTFAELLADASRTHNWVKFIREGWT